MALTLARVVDAQVKRQINLHRIDNKFLKENCFDDKINFW
jgi:hypothetical protein